ncbi:hypothetical protein AVEN_219753-1 [Araneus ventricosus]|uniref:RNA-directed DNA polymerase n=1 Tax=Araneus ventricosus TaxID=182803 RepID=A0A4Y2URZ9_ARAVE|nr:hypothetical protein AVEN_219753-1 [Araneus ventricosus]
MQFGLCNASATFQRFIDEVTRGLPGVYAFVDDNLIAFKNPEQHCQHLKTLFSRLDEYGLCMNVSKCMFGASTIDCFGFNLSENGIKALPDKVKCILDFPKPDTLTQLRSELAKDQQNDPETQKLLQDKSSSLQIALKPCLSTNSDFICDISTGSSRPESFRRLIFEQLHSISHPGIAATTKLISARYVWPNMKHNIKEWVRCCEPCQRCKV